MKTLDPAQRQLCELQAQIFDASLQLECGSAVFVRRFLNSNLAARMDRGGYSAEIYSVEGALGEIEEEFGPSTYGSVKFSTEELHWMGYLYRYWCLATGMSSKLVFKIAGSRELRGLFAAYHTLDPAQAVERILEAKGISPDFDSIERGVRVMREVRRRRAAGEPFPKNRRDYTFLSADLP